MHDETLKCENIHYYSIYELQTFNVTLQKTSQLMVYLLIFFKKNCTNLYLVNANQ